MQRVFATELRNKPAVLDVLPRRYVSDSSRRRFANSHAVAGHNFGNVALVYEENLAGQPASDAADDTADVATPMSDTDLSGTKTGATGCDAGTGKVFTSTLNKDDCTKDCSTRHEEKHAADITPCCAKAGEAAKAAKTDAEKADIQSKFDNWMLSNKPFLECRAYEVSVTCGNAKHKKANCEKESYGKCCKSLVWYIRSATLGGQAACAQADKKLSDCPFS